ncbi:MAG: AAA family ATPase [Saprospiraceae bacterium]|nr:AAA family ATPase [Saprospiraceae bacterium]
MDEIDKLSSSYNKLDIKGNNVLFELLHILEENSTSGANSYDKFATRTTIDTSNFCFVFAGAFQGLFVPNQSPAHPIGFDRCLNSEAQSGSGDDLEAIIKFGIPREIIGRIGWILHLKPLERDVFRDILLSTEESPLTYYRKLYEIHSSVLHLSEKEIDLVIASAISKNVGARGLRQALQEFLSDRLNILFNL